MKWLAFSIVLLSTFANAEPVGLERSPMLGVYYNYDANYIEKSGLVKRGFVTWQSVLNKCEPSLWVENNTNQYIVNRCCYKSLEELNVVGEPLFTLDGAHEISSIPKIQKFANGSNAIMSMATAQFQKVKLPNNLAKYRLAMCLHVIYENASGVNSDDTNNIFNMMKQYAAVHADWKLEYFYIESPQTTCDLIIKNADLNADGKVSSLDIFKLNKDYVIKNIYDKKYDFNLDGKLDILDMNLLRDYLLQKFQCSAV